MALASLAALLLFGELQASRAVPIIGDVSLIRMVRDAQVTNAAMFQRGEMHVTIHNKITDRHITTTIVWDGEKTFWDYDLSEQVPVARVGVPGGKTSLNTERGRMIDDGRRLSHYWPDLQFAQFIDARSPSYRLEFKVRPADIWFTMEGIILWSKLLDPDANATTPTLSARMDGDDRIVIEHRNPRNDILTVIASIAKGGNIIEYESKPNAKYVKLPTESPSVWRKGTYDWAEDARGAWYLKHLAYQRSHTGSPNEVHLDFEFDVDSFNPDPVIPPDRFDSASLQLPVGTQVEELGKKPKTYRIGDPPETKAEKLDSLADVLRQKAFIRGRSK